MVEDKNERIGLEDEKIRECL